MQGKRLTKKDPELYPPQQIEYSDSLMNRVVFQMNWIYCQQRTSYHEGSKICDPQEDN